MSYCKSIEQIFKEINDCDPYSTDHAHCDEKTCWFEPENMVSFYKTYRHQISDDCFEDFVTMFYIRCVRHSSPDIWDGDEEVNLKKPFVELLTLWHNERHDSFHKYMDEIVCEYADGLEDFLHYEKIWNKAKLPKECMPECIQECHKE